MNTTQVLRRLEKIVGPDLETLSENAIFREQDQYNMFNTWSITPGPGLVQVVDRQSHAMTFENLKIAAAWCIAKKYKNAQLAQEIEQLDHKQSVLKTDIAITKRLLTRIHDREQKTISQIKLEDKQVRLRFAQSQMEKCVNRAKYCQLRGFNDEIARTRRPAPNRTDYQGTRKSRWSQHQS